MIHRSSIVIAAGALCALAAWPCFAPPRAGMAHESPLAAVNRDYLRRDALIAFDEAQVRESFGDQITRRMLASQYLQRFREQGDVGDVARAGRMARESLALQPQGNTAAQMALASALLTYHDFKGALVHEDAAIAGEPFNTNAYAQKASLLMEVGRYVQAQQTLKHRADRIENPTWDSVQARYDEETGRLGHARALIARAQGFMDRQPFVPAYDRAWYHVRAGQLAFEAGDERAAERDYAQALEIFPGNSMALMLQAQLFRAERRWNRALAAASASAAIYPLPQALGYEADAQRALGKYADARSTDELIYAEQRLFDVQGINDRLLAVYYIQRGAHLQAALAAARSDYRKRGDEIYADDTLAWSFAALDRWNGARAFSVRATRLGTRDAMLWYHRGVIAFHTGRIAEARADLHFALQLNPDFDPFDVSRAQGLLRRTNQQKATGTDI